MCIRDRIGAEETATDLMSRLSFVGAELLSDTLANLDMIAPVKQNDELATLAPIMKREDGLIDWQLTAGEISNRVRGFRPFPGSYTFINGAKITLWRTFPTNSLDNAKSGEILTATGDIFEVGCHNGTVLRIEEVQPEGKRRMAVRDFLNGAKPQTGTILGK